MLEGKAILMFEEWFKVTHPRFDLLSDWESIGFYSLPPSMQFGVIQDWADSVGVEIGCYRGVDQWLWFCNDNKTRKHNGSEVSTRQEAREAAITKLSELVNNKYK